MITAGSKVLLSGQLDRNSINVAFANIPVEYLKLAAQKLRERKDWYGFKGYEYMIYDCMISVIKISDPSFETEFIPAT